MRAGSDTVREPDGALQSVPRGLLIGGRWVEAADGRELEVEDPALGISICRVADASVDDGLLALEAATEAQPSWRGVPAWERGGILRDARDAVLDRGEQFAMLISLESGKALDEARAELAYATDFLRWYSEEAARIAGTHMPAPQGGSRLLTTRHPVGSCLLVTPWNFPLAMATRKIAPALAAGCSVILKPASRAPLTSLAFAEVLMRVGVPDGVVNVLPTARSGPLVEALVADGRLRKLSFTGSTSVGRRLLHLCAERVLRTSMELGGNAPLIVFDDCDLERAVDGAVLAKLRNSGQSCIAANRIYVQRGVGEAFTEALAERFEQVRMGAALEGGELGPLIDAEAVQKVSALLDDAVGRGATVAVGGDPPEAPGYFLPPTLLVGVDRGARVMREEIFGPVAPVSEFRRESEAIDAANSTFHGLVAYLFTQDLDRAFRVADQLEAGMVGINRGIVSNAAAPFGGVKESGLGREGGVEGIAEYLETQYVAIDEAPAFDQDEAA